MGAQSATIPDRAPTQAASAGANGAACLWFRSADNIRGYGFQGIVVDEAASIPPDVWHYVLRPTMARRTGECFAMDRFNHLD